MAFLGLVPDAMMLPILITVLGALYLIFLQGLFQPFFGFKDDIIVILIIISSWLLYYSGVVVSDFLSKDENLIILAGGIVFGSALFYAISQRTGRRRK